MEEYVEDVLADDSDDEKHLEKAERAAEHKLAKKRKVAVELDASKKQFFKPAEEAPLKW